MMLYVELVAFTATLIACFLITLSYNDMRRGEAKKSLEARRRPGTKSRRLCPVCGGEYKTRTLYYRGTTYFVRECPVCAQAQKNKVSRTASQCSHSVTRPIEGGRYVCKECGEILERSPHVQ